jgi:hypothetical protein
MGMSTALRSFGLLDVLSGTSPASSVARLVSMSISTASLRNPMRNAGLSWAPIRERHQSPITDFAVLTFSGITFNREQTNPNAKNR